MPRNLDLTAVRSFVTVAEAGGVTRAAGLLNLTQSAVSMQLKRLEDSLGVALLDRSARRIALTPAGERMLAPARQMLGINDDLFHRFTGPELEGEITLGVPHDIIYPAIPEVLRRFAAEFPRMRVNLICSFTRTLKAQFAKGAADVILTTEAAAEDGAETLSTRKLLWVGAPGGTAWRGRPLRLAFERTCIFRPGVQDRLEAAGLAWDMAVESDASRSIDATISADLAISARLEGTLPEYFETVAHGGALPDLTEIRVNLYVAQEGRNAAAAALAGLLRNAFGTAHPGQGQGNAGTAPVVALSARG